MDFSLIGKKIKELRKTAGITQGELANGICTQALISRIEKGVNDPSADVLYQVSKKLGVDVNHFFEIGSTPRLDYIREVERQLRKLRVKLAYEDILDIIKTEEKNPLFMNDGYNKQLLLWHRGIYAQEVEKDGDKAYAMMKEALMLTYDEKKAMSEREMSISISLGIIEFTRCRYEEALQIFKKVGDSVRLSSHLHDKAIKTRLYYNIARVLTRQARYKESIEHCEKALSWNIEVENLYGFSQLYYHIGYNLELQGFWKEAVLYFEKAEMLFKIQGNQNLVSFINSKKKELLQKNTNN
jgi:transcriptional regulator with XRE-family HTH domain